MSMPFARLELRWQGRGGRPLTARLLVRIDSIRRTFTLFGLTNSPSVAGHQPDPRTVRGWILSGPDGMAGRRFKIKLPGHEAKALVARTPAGLALAADPRRGDDVVVSIAPVPAGAMAAPWLAAWQPPAD